MPDEPATKKDVEEVRGEIKELRSEIQDLRQHMARSSKANAEQMLSEIKVLLERITETQGLDLLMKRMELSSTQVVEIEKRLRESESERATVEDENIRLEMNMQAYTVERAKQEARRKGHSTTEQTLADGSIKLTIQVAGGAA